MNRNLLLSLLFLLTFPILPCAAQLTDSYNYMPGELSALRIPVSITSIQDSQGIQSEIRNNFWFGIGPGFFSSDTYEGISLYTSLSLSRDKYKNLDDKTRHSNISMSLRVMNYSTIGSENISGRKLNDFSLLCGTSLGKVFRFRISAGIGLLRYFKTIQGSYNPYGPPVSTDVYYNTLTVPVEAGVEIMFSRYAGLGICGFSGISSKKMISGFNINLFAGKIR